MPELKKLDDMLACHDWYYDYSDDGRVWSKGSLEAAEIAKEMSRLAEIGLEAEARELYNEYV